MEKIYYDTEDARFVTLEDLKNEYEMHGDWNESWFFNLVEVVKPEILGYRVEAKIRVSTKLVKNSENKKD